jgi:spermidine synthase
MADNQRAGELRTRGNDHPFLLLACFALSGFAALVYQIAWNKALGLLFGYSAYATAMVLAVFMGGLALGSAWIGKECHRVANAIALYGWIEVGVAVSGIFSVAWLTAVRGVYLHAYPLVASWRFLSLGLRFCGAALVLLIPTILMGGTLPVLSRVARRTEEFGVWVSRLYAMNTLGAVLGTLAAGFVLLPQLGLRLTVTAAAALNLVAGGVALLLSRSQRTETTCGEPSIVESGDARMEERRVSKMLALPLGSPAMLLTCFAVVGGTAMAYEISWTRLLATMLGSSVYAFTLILATFLGGMAFGGFLFERWLARKHSVSLATFATTQAATAGAALLFLVFYQQIPSIIPPTIRLAHGNFAGVLLAQFVSSGLATFPVAALFGFSFPAVLALVARACTARSTTAEVVGRAYAANTAGAILSAVVTGFILLPRLGSYRVVALAGALNLMLAVFLELRCSRKRRLILAIEGTLLVGLLAAGASSYFYSRAMAAFGAVLYANFQHAGLTLAELANTEDVLFFEDGVNASISVARSDDYVALKTNGKVDASNLDESTQLLLGDLGAIFQEHPRRVLIIGFGGGMTASAVSRFPEVERIDCIEIEPAVLHAAPYLGRLNRGVLADPRLHFIFDDARNTLQTLASSYDVIISEPSNPWIAGVAALYTDEFYAALRERLAPGGVFVQWIQGYSLATDDFRMILASLAPHFADVTLWHSAGNDFLVLARIDASPLRFDRSRALWSNGQLQQDFHALRLTRPESWPVYFRLGDREVREFVADAPINSDDRTPLEFRAPRTLLQKDADRALEKSVFTRQKDLLPAELEPSERAAALEASAESAVELNALSASALVQALIPGPAAATVEILRGRALLEEGRVMEAGEHFEAARAAGDNLYRGEYWLAIAQHQAGSVVQADVLLDEVIQRAPNLQALRSRVDFARDNQDWPAAIAAQQKLLDIEKQAANANDDCRLGDLYLRAGNVADAEAPLRRGLEKDPYSFLCRRDLGELLRVTNRASEAEQHLEFVVRFFPAADAQTYASLALAYSAEKRSGAAKRTVEKDLRIFPQGALLRQLHLPK